MIAPVRTVRVAALAAGLAALAVAAAGASTAKKVDTTGRITEGGATGFTAKIKADDDDCVPRRRVYLNYDYFGDKMRVGTERSNGRGKVEFDGQFTAGEYAIKIAKREIDSHDGRDLICQPFVSAYHSF